MHLTPTYLNINEEKLFLNSEGQQYLSSEGVQEVVSSPTICFYTFVIIMIAQITGGWNAYLHQEKMVDGNGRRFPWSCCHESFASYCGPDPAPFGESDGERDALRLLFLSNHPFKSQGRCGAKKKWLQMSRDKGEGQGNPGGIFLSPTGQ